MSSSEQPDLFQAAPAPGFVRKAQPAFRAGAAWWLAAGGLALLAALQWLWVERDALAMQAQWRPAVERTCAWMGCSLPAWHEPSAFSVTARDVRPHPSVDGALLITATFRNDAAFAQPWPVVELSLSDLNGRIVGLRHFPAEDYLGGMPPQPLLEAGQSARLTLEVVEGDRAAVAFAFDFH
jgi:hypothetical protein